MILQDGSGSGYNAKIDDELRLSTFSVTEPEDKHINREGKQWSLYFTTTPVGAGDYFFYLKNTGTADYAISDIRVMAAATETLTYEWVSGAPSYTAASDITPIARNGGSSKIPSATIKSDTNITGLTSQGVLFFERIDTANKRYGLSTSSNIIIPQGAAIAFKAETGTSLITCVVSLTSLDS